MGLYTCINSTFKRNKGIIKIVGKIMFFIIGTLIEFVCLWQGVLVGGLQLVLGTFIPWLLLALIFIKM